MEDPVIYVIAGVNGAGKSSVGGAMFASLGVECYNPDLVAARLREMHPGMTQEMANGHAWSLGKEMLEKAIARGETYAFETTLGGSTLVGLLMQAAERGLKVKVWYVGLESVEMNLGRVRARVERGGHGIPESMIRKRWDSSRRNLIKLLPLLHSLRLYDNSLEGDPMEGERPRPRLLLRVEAGKLVGEACLDVPEWAKPIVAGVWRVCG